ncbi:conserved hypothetical protein [Bradyrhizobium oligotrophicum S58]|uniref:Aminotransferase class I/classII domain-containing protein n=1 Tax=Bradyrhizobium oligotrophicum S58 TaxID=1245469 RepID=M4Z131_9BRAD|nr:hypothetical protein [Bradyrhizobium oligotrophicum]BAM86818.1 conserved hypothetical protein [Bradyrhizobium oligotrophicum S58]
METIEAYLARKHQELQLLNACLRRPHAVPAPRSVMEVVRHKFQFTAALKAEHALNDWTATETAWADADDHRAGPFAFSYDYQRADLDVRGPSFYAAGGSRHDTVYTISGMAAIAALLLAMRPALGTADLLMLPGSYGETQELIAAHARHLHPVTLTRDLANALAQPSPAPRLLLIDSSATTSRFEAVLSCDRPAIDLLIFDTTCFANGSGRIRRVLAWARRWDVPVVMVRSHTKLDSLGAEYGRLGSVAYVDWATASSTKRLALAALPEETRNAVRLLGGAALPAHFPPYVGISAYRALTARRVAAILRNSRRARRLFATTLRGLTAELDFAHGLYVTLASHAPLDEVTARQAATAMSDDLRRAGLPIRHAGSFGFDFAATEWFHDATTDRYSVRVAVPDLPTAIWDELTDAIAGWWSAHQGRSAAA